MASYSAQYYDYSNAVPIPSKHEQYSSYYASGGSNYSASPDDSYNAAYNDASVTSGAPSYQTGDYSSQTSAMDANCFALEGCGAAGYTLWVYTAQVSRLTFD